MSLPLHLIRRFFMSLRGRSPSEFDLSWATGLLSGPERELFLRMSASDRAHSIDVSRRVSAGASDFEPHVLNTMLVAALLHDVGKIEADAGVALRVVATLCESLRLAGPLGRWIQASGPLGRLARQLQYPVLGAQLLVDIDSDVLVSTWAREHHRPRGDWSVPLDVGEVLRRADEAAS
ncbi:MAG: hypothetical protein ACKVHU_05665 [Acidimicrobiales bacterium]